MNRHQLSNPIHCFPIPNSAAQPYTAMLTRIWSPFLLIIFHILAVHSSVIPPFNLSHFLYPKVTAFTESQITPQPPSFLQGVLDAIADKEKWELDDIRVSELDVKKAKYSSVQRYEFRVRTGTTEIVLKMYEEVSEWKKLVAPRQNLTSNFEVLAREVGSKTVIDSFKIEGPFELRVAGDDDLLSLMLPSNNSHTGLRQISVGEGITVEVKGAKEISMSHPYSGYHLPYGILTSVKSNGVGSIWPPFCTAPQTVHILGPASILAYRKGRPASLIQTTSSSTDSIELLPEKCYYEKPRHLLSSLSIRIALLERVLRTFLNGNGDKSRKVKIQASILFRFRLELERDIRINDAYWSTLAEWRTRPAIERSLFEVVARIESEVLKPLIVKKVRPVMDADSFTWSSLLSNLSFTKFPPVFVPPEALTLDVKW